MLNGTENGTTATMDVPVLAAEAAPKPKTLSEMVWDIQQAQEDVRAAERRVAAEEDALKAALDNLTDALHAAEPLRRMFCVQSSKPNGTHRERPPVRGGIADAMYAAVAVGKTISRADLIDAVASKTGDAVDREFVSSNVSARLSSNRHSWQRVGNGMWKRIA